MRLAIIRRRYTPYGGAERFIERIAAKLSEKGVSTTIIAEQWDASKNQVALLEIVRASSHGWFRTERFYTFQQSVKKILHERSFDLVQSHERLLGAAIYRAGDGVHTAWIQRRLREVGKWKAWWLQRDPYHRAIIAMEKQMASDPHLQMVANSTLVASELHEILGVPLHRITVIPNGLDTAHFAPPEPHERKAARKKFHLPPEAPTLVFVGSGFARKGAYQLTEALRQLPDAFLLICGYDKNRRSLEALIKKFHLGSRVKILGAMNDVRPALHASHIFALPSLYDPSPNAALEALSCGLPVVTTNDTGLAQEISTADAGLICTRNPADIARTLESLLADAEQLSMMGKNARNLALKFDQEMIVNRWLDFYWAQTLPAS